jgi:hypothetical protein
MKLRNQPYASKMGAKRKKKKYLCGNYSSLTSLSSVLIDSEGF